VAVNISKSVVNSTFLENEFLNSTILHAWDNSTNSNWNNATHGNYWDDYTGEDTNQDGIGDTAYNISGAGGAVDQYPLYRETEPHPEPIIELISPENSSIIKSSTQLELNITNSNGSILYNWDTKDNITILTSQNIPFPSDDGVHSIDIYVTNSFGNWTYKSYVFVIDNTEPVIDPVDDITNGSEVGTGTSIPFNVFDSNFEEFWYYWNNSGGSTTPEHTVIPYAEVPLITGEWTLNVYANDSAGNVAQFTITVNVLAAASITILYPNGGKIVGGFVNISWISSQSLTYDLYYSPDNGSSWVTLAEDISDTYWLWNTAIQPLNGSMFLVRVLSVTSGHPGEARSEGVFTIFNLVQQQFPVGTSEIFFPDINITIILSEPTNVTIQRITTLENYMDPNATNFYSYGVFLEVTLENPDALETLIIKFDVLFLKDTLKQQGLSIYDVVVYFFNETSSQWEPADLTEYDIINWVITGHFNHTTTIGILGKSRTEPTGPGINPFFLLFVSLTIFATVLGGGYYVYYQKKKR
ncbi:MAG: hypothetical protein ACTSW1_05705, partial [Candidatus Hodarchaeales archaeon]